jgi:hypothetical protein
MRFMERFKERRGLGVSDAVGIMVALIVVGALIETAFDGIEAWTPTDPALTAIKPLLLILGVIALAYSIGGKILKK